MPNIPRRKGVQARRDGVCHERERKLAVLYQRWE